MEARALSRWTLIRVGEWLPEREPAIAAHSQKGTELDSRRDAGVGDDGEIPSCGEQRGGSSALKHGAESLVLGDLVAMAQQSWMDSSASAIQHRRHHIDTSAAGLLCVIFY